MYGRLDTLVHCAAENAHGLVPGMDEAAFDQLIYGNVHSLFWLARDAHPWLSRGPTPGRVVFISSSAANRSHIPGLVPYTATKAYVNAFARGLALEWGRDGVLVNVVEPGMIASDRLRDHLTEERVAQVARRFPVPRAGECHEIASAVLFLVSHEARYITGSSLLVDGGASMTAPGDLSDNLH